MSGFSFVLQSKICCGKIYPSITTPNILGGAEMLMEQVNILDLPL